MIKVDRNFINVVARSLAGNMEIQVKESESWAFDLEKKILYYDPMTLLQKDSHVARGFLLHEVGHVKYTRLVQSSDVYKKYPNISIIYNALEDMRIEGKLNGEYGDYSKASVNMKNDAFLENFFFDMELMGKNPVVEIGAVILVYGHHLSAGLTPKLREIGSNLERMVSNKSHEKLQIIQQKIGLSDVAETAMRKLMSFEQVQKYVDKHIFPIIKDLLEEDPGEEQGGGGEGESDEQDDSGGGGESEEGGEESQGKQDGVAQVLSQTFEGATGVGGERGAGQKSFSYAEASALTNSYSSYMAVRILNILKENHSFGFHGFHKKGKLLSKNTTKLVMGEERVFSKRNQMDKPRYRLLLGLDGSGSMHQGGGLIRDAHLGAVVAFDTFKKINMKSDIVQFANKTRVLVENGKMNRLFKDWVPPGGGTNDTAMSRDLAELAKANPDEEILTIIIGDGCGEGLHNDSIKYLEKRGVIVSLGIGSAASDVAKYYPNGVVVDNVSEVPNVILKILQNYIQR